MKWFIALLVLPTLVSAMVAALVFAPALLRHRQDASLRAGGLLATATILAMQDTGSRVNMQPVANITLQVSPPDGAAFQSSAQVVVTPINGPLFQPGRQVRVRYSPQSPAQVVIVASGAP